MLDWYYLSNIMSHPQFPRSLIRCRQIFPVFLAYGFEKQQIRKFHVSIPISNAEMPAR